MYPLNLPATKKYFIEQKISRVTEKWGFLAESSFFKRILYKKIVSEKRFDHFMDTYLNGKRVDWSLLPQNLSGDILDIGCDIPIDAYWLQKITAVKTCTVVDLKPVNTTRIPKLSYVNADATRLPFPDNTFDTVMCFSAIEHVLRRDLQKKWVHEMTRVVKPGGVVSVTVDNMWSILNGFPFYCIFPCNFMLPISWKLLENMIITSGNIKIRKKASGRIYQYTSWFRPWAESYPSYLLEKMLSPLSGKFPAVDARIGYSYSKMNHVHEKDL